MCLLLTRQLLLLKIELNRVMYMDFFKNVKFKLVKTGENACDSGHNGKCIFSL